MKQLFNEAAKRREKLRRRQEEALNREYTFENNKDVLTANTFLLSDFRWAISCVVSRQNPLPSPVDPSKTTLALIPIFEMLNHQPKSCSQERLKATNTLKYNKKR